jgi:hypothetical protein
VIDPIILEKIDAVLAKVYSRMDKKSDIQPASITKDEVKHSSMDFCIGDRVKLIACEKKHLNKEGKVVKVGRKNYHVEISGLKNPLYLHSEQLIKI